MFGKINDGGFGSTASRKKYQDTSLERCNKNHRDIIDSKGTR